MKVNLKMARCAFLDIFEPSTFGGEGAPSFGANFLLEPKSDNAKAVEAAMLDAAKAKWGVKAEAQLKALVATDKVCLHDGDNKPDYDGFAGTVYVSARSPTRPLVIDRDKSPLIKADGRPYSGCYVNAQIEIWAQDNSFGKRVNAQLKGIQFVKDGDAFGGSAPASADDFEDLAVEEEDALA